MDYNEKLTNSIWSFLVGLVTSVLGRSFVIRKILTVVINYTAKPIYDFVLRKGYIALEKERAKKAEDKLDNASTIEEAKKAVDDIP